MSFLENESAMSVALALTLKLDDRAPVSSFFILGGAEEWVVTVGMRPITLPREKTLAVAAPMLRLAPMMATNKGEPSLLVEVARDVGFVLLSSVLRSLPVYAGAAISVV